MDRLPMEVKFDDSWAWVDMTVCRDIESDTTVLVVGDSWAWGDEIGGSCGIKSSPNSNTEYRNSKVFGNLLSHKLSANWVQFALPGASWPWVIDEYEKLVDTVASQSTNVIAILTMPDYGRELDTASAMSKTYFELFNQGNSIAQTLTAIEHTYYTRIESITKRYPNVRCLTSPSFTQNINPVNNQTESTWSELLGDFVKPLHLHTSGSWAILQFLENNKLLSSELKHEFNEGFFLNVLLCRDQMDASPLFFDRCHPNEQGHEIWANYLYNHIKNIL